MTEVYIANSRGEVVVTLAFGDGQLRCTGQLPGNLTVADLKKLGFVYYENDARGQSIARVKEVPLSEGLDYLRALNDALPPGYFLARVCSERIDAEQQLHREAFERELAMLDEPHNPAG